MQVQFNDYLLNDYHLNLSTPTSGDQEAGKPEHHATNLTRLALCKAELC